MDAHETHFVTGSFHNLYLNMRHQPLFHRQIIYISLQITIQ